MPKLKVTPSLGSALKSIRTQRKIKAVDIAKNIGKTGAFISKLENGDLNSIEVKDLKSIIKFVSKDEEDFETVIEELLKWTSVQYSDEEIEKEEWYMNLDLLYRTIKIPQQYVTIVTEEFDKLNITLEEFIDYINKNDDLYNDPIFSKELLDNSEKNKWIFNNGHSFIIMDINPKTIQGIFNHTITATNYSIMECILVTIFKLQNFTNKDSYNKALEILHDLRIFTLEEKSRIMKSFSEPNLSILTQQNNHKLPEADLKLIASLNQFVRNITTFSEIHGDYLDYTNEHIVTMNTNFHKDPILFLAYNGIDLSPITKKPKKLQREFLDKINELVDEYSKKEIQEELL